MLQHFRNLGNFPPLSDKVDPCISCFVKFRKVNVAETLLMLGDCQMNNSTESFWAIVVGVSGCQHGKIKND